MVSEIMIDVMNKVRKKGGIRIVRVRVGWGGECSVLYNESPTEKVGK